MGKTLMSWSGGKDCTLALHKYHEICGKKPDGLLTAYSQVHNRVTMHGVRMELIEMQTDSLGIPLYTLGLTEGVTDELYEELLLSKLTKLKGQGFEKIIFGDIYLEDLRDYRIRQLEQIGLDYEFPIWQEDTRHLVSRLCTLEYKAILVSVNGTVLSEEFAGKVIDVDFNKRLPADVDPCGENGEFHTFVFEGPLLDKAVQFKLGETVKRTYKSPVDDSVVV